MKIDVKMAGLARAAEAGLARVARGTTAGMREATTGLKDDLRDQVLRAGFNQRLANTWRGNTYPRQGASLEPAAYVYSKAPKIVFAFTSGATIRPVNGSRYLWIPTDKVPKKRTRGGSAAISPEEVEQRFGPFFYRPGKRGGLVAMVVSTRRRRGAHRGQGVAMFNLRRTVDMPKLLELQRPAQAWAARAVVLIERNITR